MKMNYSEKITKINDDRNLMLNIAKEHINSSNLDECLSDITSVLYVDEQNTKEYKDIIKAKQLILELTEEIVNASSLEEVIKLRKKINYYINKIRKEINSRKISQYKQYMMQKEVSYLRENLSMYIRLLKRNSNLERISNYYNEINNLSQEDNITFKKLVSNELRYNKRVLNNLENDNKLSKPLKKIKETKNSTTPLVNNILSKDDFLIERIKYYNSIYNLDEIYSYNGSLIQNIVSLFKNISVYNWNKKIIKIAEKDYKIFYNGEDLAGFIEYSKKRNSIKTALEYIFKSSHLSKNEAQCLFNHEKCKEWIVKFYDYEDSMYKKTKQLLIIR